MIGLQLVINGWGPFSITPVRNYLLRPLARREVMVACSPLVPLRSIIRLKPSRPLISTTVGLTQSTL